MIKGRVTAIVASYNHASFLIERMDSLINQTWDDLEILVIDDCSTDNSREVLLKYSNHPKVKLINNEKNMGWVRVSNLGLTLATGEYIIFQNCDDFCENNQIEKLVQAIRLFDDTGASFCKSLMVDEKSIVYGDDLSVRTNDFKIHIAKSQYFTNLEMSKFLLHSCVLPNLSAVLFKKEVLIKNQGFSTEFLVCSDWDLFFKIAQNNGFQYVPEALNSFRQHRTTIRKSTKERIVYDEYFKLLSRFIEKINLSPIEKIKSYVWIGQLWTKHLFSKNGPMNFQYHLINNLKYNFWIVFLLPIAILIELPSAFLRKIKC